MSSSSFAASQGLVINVTYDLSVSNAPAAFQTAVTYAVSYLESVFTNPVTVNIDVGWGETDGQKLDSGTLGESDSNYTEPYSYSQIKAALTADGTSAADATALASLPPTDPTNGAGYYLTTAQAKALGLVSANATGIDGYVGFSSVSGTFAMDPNDRAVSGEYDLIGTIEHEITEVMGRAASLNTRDSPGYSVMDLFRYSAPGVRQLTTGSPAYFSINDGVTDLDNFNTNKSGDLGDWAASAGNDAFLAFTAAGAADLVTPTDLTLMDVLGWNMLLPTTVSSVVELPSTGNLNAGKSVAITVSFNNAVTVTGTPVLSLNDGGTATYTSGSGTTALSFSYTVGANDVNVASLAVVAVNPNGGTIQDTSGAAASLTLTGLTQTGPEITTNYGTLSAAFTNVMLASPTSALATTPTITLANGTSVANPIYLDANALPGLAAQVGSGQITLAQALNTIEHYGDTTTSVATIAYQFFTGATPSLAGYDYLINSPSNPNDLDSAYYAQFNEQNRYINFAVNLGKYGAGATSFNAAYGSLDLTGAMTQAYTAIFGFAPAAGKISTILNSLAPNGLGGTETVVQYFAYYGTDGPNGIGTKAAAVGWLMTVAVQADLGTYAAANDDFLAALANGTPLYNTNLLSAYPTETAAQAAATVAFLAAAGESLSNLTNPLLVADTGADVAANLDALQTLVGGNELTSVTLTDASAPILSITAAQLTADASALGAITSPYSLNVSGATAANAATIEANGHVASFSVSDTAGAISADLAALYRDSGDKLTEITITDGQPLAVTPIQLGAQENVFSIIQAPYALAVAGPTAQFNEALVPAVSASGSSLDMTDLNPATLSATFTENSGGRGDLFVSDGVHSAMVILVGLAVPVGFAGNATAAGFVFTSDGASGTHIAWH